MPETQEEKIELLRKELRISKRQSSICGWLLFLAFVCVPLSLATGNRAAGFASISFIVGNFTMFAALSAKKKQEEVQTIFNQMQFMDNLADAVKDATQSRNNSAKHDIGHIGMN